MGWMESSGYGILCRIRAPIRGGALDLVWVNLILAQVCRWNYMDKSESLGDQRNFEAVAYFLTVFAGLWPSRNLRLLVSRDIHYHGHTFPRRCLQVHFRYSEPVERLMTSGDAYGLICRREQGRIASNALGDIPSLL